MRMINGDIMLFKPILKNIKNFNGIAIFMLFLFVVIASTPGISGYTDLSSVQTAEEDSDTNSLTDLNYQKSSVDVDVPGNGSRIQIKAKDQVQLHLRDQLQINLSLQEHAELCINISESNPQGTMQNNTFRYRNYYQLELNKSTQLQARFTIQINRSELPKGFDSQKLSWAYYNNYTNSWDFSFSWLIDNQDELTTDTTHFSVWAVLALPQNTPPTPITAQGNGTIIKLKAQQQYQIKLESQFQINASFGSDIEFSINESTTSQYQYTFENHYRYGNFWSMETNNSLVEINATFGFPYDPNLLPSDVNPAQLRFYYYNTSMNQWQSAISWVNQIQKMVYTSTNHFSLWTIFVDINSSKPLEPKTDQLNDINANGTAMKIENGYTYRFRTQFGFELNVSLGKTAELKMNESIMNQYQNLNQNQKAIGKVLQIELNETGIAIQATLAYKIASSEIPSPVDPFNLTFAYYDTVTNQWKIQNSWVISTSSGYYMIYTNTTHFSTWTILGSVTTSTIEPTNSSSSVSGFEILSLLFLLPLPLFFKKKR